MGSTDSRCSRVVVAEHLGLAVLGAAQDRLAPADGDAAVDGAQSNRVDAGGAQRARRGACSPCRSRPSAWRPSSRASV